MDETKVARKLETELQIQGKSDKTIRMYTYFNLDFLRFADKSPKDMDEDDIKAYLANLMRKRSYDAASVSLAKSALRFYYDELLKMNITAGIKTPKKQRKLPDVVTLEEIKSMVKAMKKLKHKLLIELMYSSGLRVAECAKLEIKDLDLNERTGILKKGKGGKDRLIILSKTAIKTMKKYIEKEHDGSKYLFPSTNGSHMTERGILKVVHNAAKKAGIKKRVYCHLLRHAFATHLLDSDVDIRVIQELLAHSNLQTTQFYTQVSKKKLLDVVSPLDR